MTLLEGDVFYNSKINGGMMVETLNARAEKEYDMNRRFVGVQKSTI